MDSVIVRKLSDGEELVVIGQVPVSKSTANPSERSIERRNLALRQTSRGASVKPMTRPRPKS